MADQTPGERRLAKRAEFERMGVAQVRMQFAARSLSYPDALAATDWLAEKDAEAASQAAKAEARRERREKFQNGMTLLAISISAASLAVAVAAYFR